MIPYKILHHIPGRIRIEVPLLRKMSLDDLKKFSRYSFPPGIEDIKVNPLTRSMVIIYTGGFDIRKFLDDFANNEDVNSLVKERGIKI